MLEILNEVAAIGKAPATRDKHRRYLATFKQWCETYGSSPRCPCPASVETVMLFTAHLTMSGVGYTSVDDALSSIAVLHELTKQRNPLKEPIMRMFRQGYKKTRAAEKGDSQTMRIIHQPFSRDLFRRACEEAQLRLNRTRTPVKERFLIVRNIAATALGIRICARADELRNLRLTQVQFDMRSGMSAPLLVVNIRKSKTKQVADTAQRHVISPSDDETTCPVRWLQRYLNNKEYGRPWAVEKAKKSFRLLSDAEQNAIFLTSPAHTRTGNEVSAMRCGRLHDYCRSVVRYVAGTLGGWDKEKLCVFGGHSMRVTGITWLAEAGVSEPIIKAIARLTPDSAMLQTYIRTAEGVELQQDYPATTRTTPASGSSQVEPPQETLKGRRRNVRVSEEEREKRLEELLEQPWSDQIEKEWEDATSILADMSARGPLSHSLTSTMEF